MNRHAPYKHLLSSGSIGSLETRNRMIMAGMGTNFGSEDGFVTERTKKYYEARARGGIGMIVVEVTAIDYPNGTATPGQLGISGDAFLPGLKALTDTIHSHGAKVSIQLHHAGKNAVMDIIAGRPMQVPSEPSAVIGGMDDMTPEETESMVKNLTADGAKLHYHVMTEADISRLVEKYADAAHRAKQAGFDGVEVHAGHGYIISMFLSPATNKRTDQYGGSLENRARLLCEVIRAVKERTGEDFPVWFRLDAREFRIENGITLENACKTAQLAEGAGADAVHVSAYANPALGFAFTEAPLVHEPDGYLAFSEQIKKAVNIPVIAVGRIEPEEGSRAIKNGKADFIAMGRKLLAEPDLPNKLSKKEPENIRPCIYCYTCVGKIFLNEAACCAANPAMGKEADFELIPADKPKNVLVVGGGPAGMEAARVAALRGHRVTLCEKEDRLGGTAFFASIIYPENAGLVDFLTAQMHHLPIDLQLGKEVDGDFIKSLAPDRILLAQGAKRTAPPIPGVEKRHVFTGDDLRELLVGTKSQAAQKLSLGQRALVAGGGLLGITKDLNMIRKMTKLWMPLGKQTVIIGGGLVGVELAGFLTDRGIQVTILEEKDYLAPEMSPPRRWRELHHLRGQGVTMITGIQIEEILDQAVAFITPDREKKTAKAESVILATGAIPNHGLLDQINSLGFETHLIGDCREIGYIEGAMVDGARMGREI